MEIRSVATNFLAALSAQGVNIATGIIASLIVPKILGVEAYGYYQLFIFYAGYVGFFHFGLCDGVYLQEGGKTRAQLNARSMNAQLLFCVLMQVVLAAVIIAAALLGHFGEDRAFVLTFTALFLVLNNASTFIGYLFQTTNEIKLYAKTIAFNGIIFLVALVLLVALDVKDFRAYVFAYTLACFAALIYRLIAIRSILTAGMLPIAQGIKDSINSIRIGIKLMLANISAMLILGIARFALDAHWGIEVFSYVSFALSIVSLFVTFISQASMVLFPALRRSTAESQRQFFIFTRKTLDLGLPLIYLLYLPISAFVLWWLPSYEQSLRWLALLLPFCVFNGKMDIIGATYLKVLRGEKKLLHINVCALLISVVSVGLGVFVLDSAFILLLGAVVAIVYRCIHAETYVARTMEAPKDNLTWSLVVLSVVFLVVTYTLPIAAATGCMIAAYAMYALVYRRDVGEVLSAAQGLSGNRSN